MSLSVLLVGCGKMGSALLKGWLKSPELSGTVFNVVDPAQSGFDASIKALPNVKVFHQVTDVPENLKPDVIFFAVKPKDLENSVASSGRFSSESILLISVAAGKTISSIENNFPSKVAVVRAMPNLPALISEGVTVMCANGVAGKKHKHLAEELLSSVGQVFWVDDENLINPVTAVSGSGPAYLFLFAEAMREAGISNGLPAELSEKLTLLTLCGAAKMALESADSLETLRQNVTSPGGTTEAALKVLMQDDKLRQLVSRAVNAANTRASELENG